MEVKAGVVGRAIAGTVGGAICTIIGFSLALAGLVGIAEPIPMEDLPPMSVVVTSFILMELIAGTILGLFYTKLYMSIPGERVLKGVYYGLLIWFIKDLLSGMYMIGGFMATYMALTFILLGFPLWLIYGAVLGFTYEKIK